MNIKRILIFMEGYIPAKNYGGPTISIKNIADLYGDEIEFYIVTRNHELDDTRPFENIKIGWNVVDRANVMYLSERDVTVRKLKDIIYEVNPDFLYLNCIYDAIFVLRLLYISKREKLKILLAPRGSLHEASIKHKQYKKKPYIWIIRTFLLGKHVLYQATTLSEIDDISKILKVKKERILLWENIPNIPKPSHAKQIKIAGKLKLIYLARIDPHKNLKLVLEFLKLVKGEIQFDIYGPIENKIYWDHCKQLITHEPQNVRVNYLGPVDNDLVHHTYGKYDAMILPTRSENYGQSIAESLLALCPVIISDQTPWTDINSYRAGWAIPINQNSDYVAAIQTITDMNRLEYDELQRNLENYVTYKFNFTEIKIKSNSVLDKIAALWGL